MSADNWEICPRCIHEAGVDVASDRVTDYRTFREDYEIYGADDGKVQVAYKGRCTKCGVGTEFTYAMSFWLPS